MGLPTTINKAYALVMDTLNLLGLFKNPKLNL